MTERRKKIPELLKIINDSDNVVEALKQYNTDSSMKNVLGYALIPKGKFLLPDGQPPYKIKNQLTDNNMPQFDYEAQRFDKFIRADLSNLKREQLYIQLLETIHETEVDLMLLIKDQTLHTVYPNITLDKVVDAGFFPWPDYLDRQEYMSKQVKTEVVKVEPPKSLEVPTISEEEPICGLKKSRGRPKKKES